MKFLTCLYFIGYSYTLQLINYQLCAHAVYHNITCSHADKESKECIKQALATKNDEPSSEVTIELSIVIQYGIMSISNRISLRRRMLIHSQRKTMLLVGYYTHKHITSTYIRMLYICIHVYSVISSITQGYAHNRMYVVTGYCYIKCRRQACMHQMW